MIAMPPDIAKSPVWAQTARLVREWPSAASEDVVSPASIEHGCAHAPRRASLLLRFGAGSEHQPQHRDAQTHHPGPG
jgi:hypothetical protein